MNTSNIVHDSVSATFNVVERGHVLMLEVDFDTHNFLKLNKCKDHKITKESFSKYLHKTTSWEFDGELLKPKVLSIKFSGHHNNKAICFLSKSKKNIKEVKIRNEFFLDIKYHSNIVMFDINNISKDFRLHDKRREIKVDFN